MEAFGDNKYHPLDAIKTPDTEALTQSMKLFSPFREVLQSEIVELDNLLHSQLPIRCPRDQEETISPHFEEMLFRVDDEAESTARLRLEHLYQKFENFRDPQIGIFLQLYICYQTPDTIPMLKEWVSSEDAVRLLFQLSEAFDETRQPEVLVLTILDMLIMSWLYSPHEYIVWEVSLDSLNAIINDPLNILSSYGLLLEVGSSFYRVAEDEKKSLLSLLKITVGEQVGNRAANDRLKKYVGYRFEGNIHDEDYFYCSTE
ncbi:MAG: hypothetical protein Q9167_005319 [Letrouitia subvulpina]